MGFFITCDLSVNWVARKPKSKIYALQKAIDKLNKMLAVQEKTKKMYLEKAARQCEKASECQEKYKSAHLDGEEIYKRIANQYENVQLIIRREVISLESLKRREIEALQDGFSTQMPRHCGFFF